MIETKEDFAKYVDNIQKQSWYKKPIGFGIARIDKGQLNSDKILQATYPVVNWGENYGSGAVFLQALRDSGVEIDTDRSEFVADVSDLFLENCIKAFKPFIGEANGQNHKNVQIVSHLSVLPNDLGLDSSHFNIVFIFEDAKPKSVQSAYLKLYALSLQKADIRSLNLDGAFGLLENVAWSGNTPIELDWLRQNEIDLKISNKYPNIDFVDKFPRFLSHIVPADNTRILDTAKVRFGARLADGTTVMPGASYINFNAGTTGAVMVEGRISSSAIVGAGSDIGGGASILGVLSGTDGNPISVGKNCLLGANSTTGIPLGDGCIIDGGLSIFGGTKVYISKDDATKINDINPNTKLNDGVVKADKLQGLNGLHFRADSQTGQVVVKRSTKEVKLNKDLH